MEIRFRKLWHPEKGRYRIELVVSWISIPLTGFWFRPCGWGGNNGEYGI